MGCQWRFDIVFHHLLLACDFSRCGVVQLRWFLSCLVPVPPAPRDKPEDIGAPPVEPPVELAPSDKGGKDNGNKPSLLEMLVQNVLKNPFIWGMALTYFFIYVVRQVKWEARAGCVGVGDGKVTAGQGGV